MKYYILLILNFTLFLLSSECLNAESLFSFQDCPKNNKYDIYTFDEKFYPQSTIISVEANIVFFEAFDEKIGYEADQIFIAEADQIYCTNLNTEPYKMHEISSLEDYNSLLSDYVIDSNNKIYYGKIIEINDSELILQSNKENTKIYKSNIFEYRYNKRIIKFTNMSIPPLWLMKISGKPRTAEKIIVPILGISSPLNLFPQVSIGILSNPEYYFHIGGRIGASGNLITAGWYYAQANVFLGLRLPDIAYFNWFISIGYLWRNNFYNFGENCQCDRNAPDYYDNSVIIHFKQKSYTLAFALHHNSIIFELGTEIPDYFSTYFEVSTTRNFAGSSKGDQSLADLKNGGASFANWVQNYSRLFFWIGYKL